MKGWQFPCDTPHRSLPSPRRAGHLNASISPPFVRISDAGPDSEAISDAAPADTVSVQQGGADLKKQGRPPNDEETQQNRILEDGNAQW